MLDSFLLIFLIAKSIIDHINGVKDDNRFLNLRLIDREGNGHNLHKPYSNNTTGYLGVSARNGHWYAQITNKGKKHHIGYFDSPIEAHQAYLKVKRSIHKFNQL